MAEILLFVSRRPMPELKKKKVKSPLLDDGRTFLRIQPRMPKRSNGF
jgi:hypothetical protein